MNTLLKVKAKNPPSYRKNIFLPNTFIAGISVNTGNCFSLKRIQSLSTWFFVVLLFILNAF